MIPLALAAVSGGVSLASGLFGREDDKKARREAARVQEENQRRVEAYNAKQEQHVERANDISAELGRRFVAAPMVKIGELVADAERYGFNPLTYLRSGAASLYGKAVDLAGYSMQQVQHIASPTIFQGSPLPQVRGMGGVIAGAAESAFGMYVSQSRIDQQQQFQRGLLEMSLKGVQKGRAAGNSSAGSSFNVPSISTAGGIKVAGMTIRSNPNTDPVEKWTQRYGEGELVENVAGIAVGWQDFKYNYGHLSTVELLKRLDQATAIDWGDLNPFAGKASGPLIVNVNKAR